MGADLLGYLVKGPKDIIQNRDAAILAAKTFEEDMNNWLYPIGIIDSNRKIPTSIIQAMDYKPGCTPEELDQYMDDCVGFVDEFIDFWNIGARDTNFRIDPDDHTQVIVFSGDMSWGDEPEGYGYKSFK